MIRTTMTASLADAPGIVRTYKNLKYVERDFRTIKIDDLETKTPQTDPGQPAALPVPRPAQAPIDTGPADHQFQRAEIEKLTLPTPVQARAFSLLGSPVPIRIT